MKWPVTGLILVTLISLILTVAVFAAPYQQDVKPVIAQPEADATVRGVVQLVGTASHPQFQRYELYYAAWPVASDKSWTFIGPDAHFQAQPLGFLGNWDTRAVPDGAYGLRVRVVKADGNYYDSDPRRVVVANTKQPETATPTATSTPGTPTPQATVGALPPTAPVLVVLPTVGTRAPLATPTRAQGSATPSGGILSATPAASEGGNLGSLVDTGKLAKSAKTAAVYTLGLFAAIGLFFALKALLVWLWQRVRP
jgi:hypothetical protein